MSLQFFPRLLLATTALSAALAGPGVVGAVARPLPGTPVEAAAGQTSSPGDPSGPRIAPGGPVLAQLDERQLRRRERDNPGERPGNRQERRDGGIEERQRVQQRQLQERQQRQEREQRQQGQERAQRERQQGQERQQQLEQRRQQQELRQQRERQQDQERQQVRERQQQLERRQDQQREQRERLLERQRQQQRLPDQLRLEERERQYRQQQERGRRPDPLEGQQNRERELRERNLQLRERQLDQERRQQQQRQDLRQQEQEQRERLRDRERQEQQEQRQQERALEQRRQERQEQRLQEPLRERRERFGGRIGDRRDMRVDELRALRRERVEQGGRRTIIEEQDRVIVREGNRYIIRHDETDRFRRAYGDAQVRRERRGRDDVTIVRRPNGVEIITVRDPDGNVLRRIRREPAGRQVVLFENIAPRRESGTLFEEVVMLPPPRIVIPRERYIVEVESASQEDLYEAFTAPPVERIERTYTLNQVRQSPALRDRVRRVDVDTVTFDFGSWELSEEQARALTGVGEALRRAIEQNPSEVFLIEGHTDAVGNEVDNLTLSDRRAETVATILTEMFNVPAENLTTQGYGEQYLKVSTEEPERQNRRVTIRRITPLLRNEARQ